ncbi:hypothetical protein [Brachybacterium sp. FME24]|uniref:hypothetical protein n=1 Tax=Brachybacterium sp. FME24 TaxID=2742605 RepID=UPI0018661E7F|nr:hypothetical protein [Brachybacterium sp. FME24]
MRTLPRSVIALSTLALASAGVALGAGSASAALTTYCEGDAADVTVPGDLVVAEGDSCILDGVTIQGQVQVESGADLLITDSSIADQVVVAADGYFDASGSEVGGDLLSEGGYGVYLDDSAVSGSYQGGTGEDSDPFLYSYDSLIGGDVAIEQGLVHLQTVTIGGAVSSENTLYTDIVDSTLSGDLAITANAEGTAVCGSEIDGAATFTGNAGVQLGTGGGLIDCEDANYFGSDVTASDNTDGVDVSDNIIRGALTGEGNDPAPTGVDNRVRGEVGGQFTDLAPAARTMAASASPEAHADQLDSKRADRHAAAEKSAEQAGPANLR